MSFGNASEFFVLQKSQCALEYRGLGTVLEEGNLLNFVSAGIICRLYPHPYLVIPVSALSPTAHLRPVASLYSLLTYKARVFSMFKVIYKLLIVVSSSVISLPKINQKVEEHLFQEHHFITPVTVV